MTSRERVFAAFERREPDRVPAWCGASPEFRALARERLGLGGDDEALSLHLGDDFRRVFARYAGPPQRSPSSCFTHPEATSRTPFGVERHGYGYGQPLAHPLAEARTRDDIENFAWPDPGWMDCSGICEEAVRWKEKIGCSAITISFGKTSAESILRDTLALGIDDAYLVASESFSHIDSQTSARVLAAAIKKIGDIDLVLTGKQASDDDTALVASSVAGHIDWPQIGFVKKFDTVENGRIVAWRTTDSGYEIVESSLPAVCSVVKEINEPRLPSLKGKMKAKKAEIKKLDLLSLGIEPTSLINIRSIEAPKARPQGEILQGEVDEVINKLIEKLKDEQLI